MSRQAPTSFRITRSAWGAAIRRWPGGGLLAHAARSLRSLVSPVRAATRRLERSADTALLQPATVTWPDRHPMLFDALASQLTEIPRPNLLSFGCSTGEEAFTLARYLPHAQIDAVDINPACIARARRTARHRPESAILQFSCASRPDTARQAYYDAVLCLSVLRHGRLEIEMPASCEDIMPFDRFAATIDQLDRVLRPGGLLVLWGCHFRFEDTVARRRYEVLKVSGMEPQAAPFYGPDGRYLDVPAYGDFLFRKVGTSN